MMRPVTVWIALRYLGAQRTNQFASLVALASVIGVALGVAALIVVLSVMNGFENELRSRLVAITGHGAVVTGSGGANWREILADVQGFPGVESVAPYVELEAMVAVGGELAGAVIEGVDPARKSPIARSGKRTFILITSVSSLSCSPRLKILTMGSWRPSE